MMKIASRLKEIWRRFRSADFTGEFVRPFWAERLSDRAGNGEPMKKLLSLLCLFLLGSASAQTNTRANNGTFAGALTAPNVNNHYVIDGCNPGNASPKYAFSAAGINAAIAAAIAAGGGIVDATGCGGQSATMTAEIDVGNASFVPVLLLLPQSGVWTWNLTDGVSYGVKVFNKSSMIGTCTGEGCAMTLQVGNTANMAATVGTPNSGLCGYVKLQGFQAAAASGAVLSKAALYITNVCDSTRIDSVAAVVNGQTGVLVSNACCGLVFQNLVSEGNQVANSVPLVLNEASVLNADLTFIGGSFVHPGAGKNAILFSSASGANTFGANFLGIHLEGNNTDTTTPVVQFPTIAGFARFFGGGHIWQDSSTAYVFNRPNASTFDFTVEGFRMLGGAGADFNAINDVTAGITVGANTTTGTVPMYSTREVYVSKLAVPPGGFVNTTGGGGIMVGTVGSALEKAETGSADANVFTASPAAIAATYRACFYASVSSATNGVIGWTLSWTDSNGNAQSNIAQSIFQFGTAAPALTFTTSAAGNYGSCVPIDVNNAGASIVFKWVGGGTTAAKVSAVLERVQP